MGIFSHSFRPYTALLLRQTFSLLMSGVCVLCLIACDSNKSSAGIPAFQISELSGKVTSEKDLAGKVAVINFWATSCTTCVKEMPQMVEIYKEFSPRGLDFLAIAMSYDPPMYVMNFAKTRELPFRVAMDSEGKAAKAFGKVELTPTTLVIDRQGKILKRYVGEPDWKEFRSVIEAALATKPA